MVWWAAYAVTKSCISPPPQRRAPARLANAGPACMARNAESISCRATVLITCVSRRWSCVSTGVSGLSGCGTRRSCCGACGADVPWPVRVIIIVVPGLKLKPWYVLTTDLALDPRDAVRAYDGRYQIEVNMDEVKEWGLGHYQGRSGQGVRRWPLFLCLGQMILKFIATGVLTVPLPTLHWPWYTRENTVGQVRRRLIEACHPRISCVKAHRPIRQKLAHAA